MRSVYVRLAAPIQSWAGDRLTGNQVQTKPRPTRTGLEGMIAAAMGVPRGDWSRSGALPETMSWIRDIFITIRTDSPGAVQDEFNTINPRAEDDDFYRRMVTLQTGKMPKKIHSTPDGQDKTAVIHRTILTGAVFIVELNAAERAPELYRALSNPVFSPYLGKRAYAPDFPFLLGIGADGLLDKLPTMDALTDAVRAGKAALSLYSVNRDHGRAVDPIILPTYVSADFVTKQEWFRAIKELMTYTGVQREGAMI